MAAPPKHVPMSRRVSSMDVAIDGNTLCPNTKPVLVLVYKDWIHPFRNIDPINSSLLVSLSPP